MLMEKMPCTGTCSWSTAEQGCRSPELWLLCLPSKAVLPSSCSEQNCCIYLVGRGYSQELIHSSVPGGYGAGLPGLSRLPCCQVSVCAVGVPVHWDFLFLSPPSSFLSLLRLKFFFNYLVLFWGLLPSHSHCLFHPGSSKNSGWCGPGDPATEKPRRGGK